jgi:hypothetical protein
VNGFVLHGASGLEHEIRRRAEREQLEAEAGERRDGGVLHARSE